MLKTTSDDQQWSNRTTTNSSQAAGIRDSMCHWLAPCICLCVSVCVCVHSSTLPVALHGNLYHTGCSLIQHDLPPGCHQHSRRLSQAMISGRRRSSQHYPHSRNSYVCLEHCNDLFPPRKLWTETHSSGNRKSNHPLRPDMREVQHCISFSRGL